MAIEEEPEVGIPEWVVTFGDMMSLLLTFFIMLVSMSEMKQEEKFQAMMESMREQFGHTTATDSMVPGPNRARNSNMAFLASMGRAKLQDIMRGGNDVKAIKGDHLKVEIVRPGKHTNVGGMIAFDEDSATLTEQGKLSLLHIIPQLDGKPQKIEIRGHSSRKPARTGDHWDLAYKRCYSTMQFMIANGIEPQRIRLSSAAAHEPIDNGLAPERRKRNARVEVLLWDERVDDLN